MLKIFWVMASVVRNATRLFPTPHYIEIGHRKRLDCDGVPHTHPFEEEIHVLRFGVDYKIVVFFGFHLSEHVLIGVGGRLP